MFSAFTRTLITATMLALAALPLTAGRSAAQQPKNGPRIPGDARGYQTIQIWQDYARQTQLRRPTKPAVKAVPQAARPLANPAAYTRTLISPQAAPSDTAPRAADGTEFITADCCAKNLGCCGQGKACCAVRNKADCCAKGMTCCAASAACCDLAACCRLSAPCCVGNTGCCGCRK